MRVDVEAERRHPARIVANSLQRQPEWRPRDIGNRPAAEDRDGEDEIIEGDGGVPVDAEELRRRDAVDAGVAVEDGVVLVGEIKERRGDRERDHDRVDALGPHGQSADDGAEDHREDERHRQGEPPRPAEAEAMHAVDAENRHDVAGETGDRHLRQAHHASVAGEKHQAQRDRAEHVRPGEDLRQYELAGDRRHDEEDDGDKNGSRIDGLDPGGRRLGRSRPGSAFRERHGLAPRQQALRPHGQHEHHDQERENDRVGRKIGESYLLGEADDNGAESRARDRAHAPDNHHDQRG